MMVRSMHHTTHPEWQRLEGLWELVLIKQGDDHVGAQISTTAYQYGLSKLCKTRLSRYKNLHPSARSSCWFPLPHDHTPFLSHAARLKKFWSSWDEMAQKRKHILMKKGLKPADWIQLDLNYRATIDMLINCPCPRLRVQHDSLKSTLPGACSPQVVLYMPYWGNAGHT